jgi:arylsulfatase A-like enzyme
MFNLKIQNTSRQRTLATSAFMVFSNLIMLGDNTLAAGTQKPNIVIIVVDDLGSGDVSSLFRQVVKTPNIDRFAKMGVKFEAGYVPVPLCGPSRAGFLTGKYPQRFGFGENNGGIPADVQLLPGLLKNQGYYTAHIGKWHSKGPMPHDRGAYNETLCSPKSSPFLNYHKPVLARNGVVETHNEYSTDLFAREAEEFIERNKNKPFALTVAFNAPHILNVAKDAPILRKEYDAALKAGKPMDVPMINMARPADTARFNAQFPGDKARANALATIFALDQAVGRILDKLQQTGLDKNTMVVFFSDHGGHPENRSENLPLRDYKWSMYEGGIRVPFFVMYPKMLPAGLTYRNPVSTLDIFKTTTAVTGIKDPGGLDGVNLLPYLTGKIKAQPHKELFFKYGKIGAVRQDKWKLVMLEDQKVELFDLSKDVEEQNNLATTQPALVKQMRDKWKAWNSKMLPDAGKW